MTHGSLSAAREVVGRVLEVRPAEQVLITRDNRRSAALSAALAAAVDDAGAVPLEVVMPRLAYPGADVPGSVRAAAQAADVWIELNDVYMLGTPVHHDAATSGLRRFYSLTGMCIDEFVALEGGGDRDVIIELGQILAELTSDARRLTVTCRHGSDFSTSCTGCSAEPDTTTMTVGQTHITPLASSLKGRLVFDGSTWPPEGLGVLRCPVPVEFSHGLATVAGATREAHLIRAWQSQFDESAVRQLNHFSYGYHPRAALSSGRLVADERVFGALCIGFGPPQPYTYHVDMTILDATVTVDGVEIQRDGRYTNPELRKIARALGVPGYN